MVKCVPIIELSRKRQKKQIETENNTIEYFDYCFLTKIVGELINNDMLCIFELDWLEKDESLNSLKLKSNNVVDVMDYYARVIGRTNLRQEIINTFDVL